jgi:branched-subunit amino acid transport protein
MGEVLLIAGMALVTFAVRYPILALLGRIPLPEPVFRALKYVPPAVLAAIVLPAILMPAGEIDVRPTNDYLVAGIIAGLLAWRTRSVLLTIVFGMLALWGWRWVLSLVMPGAG